MTLDCPTLQIASCDFPDALVRSADKPRAEQIGVVIIADQRSGLEETLEATLDVPFCRTVLDVGELASVLQRHRCLVVCVGNLALAHAVLERARVEPVAAPVTVVTDAATTGEDVVELMHAGAKDVVFLDRTSRLAPAIERELAAAWHRRRLEQTESALARTERLRVLGQMALGIAHDVGNVLNPLALHVELLDRALRRTGVAQHSSIGALRDAVAHGMETILRLRSFARGNVAHEPQPIDLRSVATEALELVRPRAKSGACLTLAGHANPMVLGNHAALVDAVVNLVTNALDALADSGAVVVELGEDASTAWMEVVDDGPGMPRALVDRVFEPFFSTKETGTGLGLANVHATMQRHGGSVELNTSPGHGCRFRLTFPRYR